MLRHHFCPDYKNGTCVPVDYGPCPPCDYSIRELLLSFILSPSIFMHAALMFAKAGPACGQRPAGCPACPNVTELCTDAQFKTLTFNSQDYFEVRRKF